MKRDKVRSKPMTKLPKDLPPAAAVCTCLKFYRGSYGGSNPDCPLHGHGHKHPNRQADRLTPAPGKEHPAFDCRNAEFWEDDEVVKQMSEAAESTGIAEYVRILLRSDASMGDVDIEALCAIADILGIEVDEE